MVVAVTLVLEVLDDTLEGLVIFVRPPLDAHHDVPVHLQKAPITVPRKFRIARFGCNDVHRGVVHAKIQDRIHHARHRIAGAGTNRDQQRILLAAELLADRLLNLREGLIDLLHELWRVGPLVFVVIGADFSRNGKPGRNREADACHLGEAGAFAAQQGAHRTSPVGSSVTEIINVFSPLKRGFRRLGFFGHIRKNDATPPPFWHGRRKRQRNAERFSVEKFFKTTSGAGTDGKHFI